MKDTTRKAFTQFVQLLAVTFVVAAFAPATAWAQDMGDPEKGMKTFKKCKACHTVTKDGKNKVGPNLWNIVGKKAGQKDGFKYSDALKNANVTWDDESLQQWLAKPKKFIKGSKMVFAGLKKEKDRNDVISYLKTLK